MATKITPEITLEELREVIDNIIDEATERPEDWRATREEIRVMVFFGHKILDELKKLHPSY